KTMDEIRPEHAQAMAEAAKVIASFGRGGDKLLCHITPAEAALLKERGGAGDHNPQTGLLEFDEGDGPGGNNSGNSTGGQGTGNSADGGASSAGGGNDGGIGGGQTGSQGDSGNPDGGWGGV